MKDTLKRTNDTQNEYDCSEPENNRSEFENILKRQRRAMKDYHRGRNKNDLEHFCFMTHIHLCEALLALKGDT